MLKLFDKHALYNGLGSLIPIQTGATNDWPVIFVLDSRNRILTGENIVLTAA